MFATAAELVALHVRSDTAHQIDRATPTEPGAAGARQFVDLVVEDRQRVGHEEALPVGAHDGHGLGIRSPVSVANRQPDSFMACSAACAIWAAGCDAVLARSFTSLTQ